MAKFTNQHILKNTVHNYMGTIGSNVGLALMPLRIETMFLDRKVPDYNDQDKALYIFRILWRLLKAISKKDRKDERKLVKSLHELLSSIQGLFREDYMRIADLINNRIPSLLDSSNREQWAEVQFELKRITHNTDRSDNRARAFVHEVSRYTRRMKDMVTRRLDTLRKPTYKEEIERIQGIISLTTRSIRYIYSKLNEQMQDWPYITPFQRQVIQGIFCQPFSKHCLEEANRIQLTEEKYGQILKDFEEQEKDLENNLKENFDKTTSPKLDVLEKRKLHRYTLLAYLMCLWQISVLRGQSPHPTEQRVKQLRRLAARTLFNYSEELEWMQYVLKDYNYAQQKSAQGKSCTICPRSLNRFNKYIYKRKLEEYKPTERCLCVRIYPDELAVTQFKSELSAQEKADALRAMDAIIAEGKLTQKIWDELCQIYKPHRAAYILKKVILNPNLETKENDEAFTVPLAKYMPTRMILQACVYITKKNKDKRYTRPVLVSCYGNRLPDTLQVGINFNQQQTEEVAELKDDFIRLKGNLKWMTDYDEAERVGMAITLPFSRIAAAAGREKELKEIYEVASVFVHGVRENYDYSKEDASSDWEDIFTAHRYSDEGLDYIPIGTPTNILEDNDEKAYDSSETHQAEAFFKMLQSRIKVQKGKKAEWKRIDASKRLPVMDLFNQPAQSALEDMEHYDQCSEYLSNNTNAAMLDKFKGSIPLLKNISDSQSIAKFLKEHVSSTGKWPTLRIGSLPYGILPMGDFRNWHSDDNELMQLKRILIKLTGYWNRIIRQKVIYDGNSNRKNTTASSENYLKVMGLTPYSTSEYIQRETALPNMFLPLYFAACQHGKNSIDDIRDWLPGNCREASVQKFVDKWMPDKWYMPINDDSYRQVMAECELTDEERQFFDLFNYRLDAWLQGLMNMHLSDSIKQSNYKVGMGAFGWVFGLKDDKYEPISNEYILAPSVNQGITAAVLRGAYNKSIVSDNNKDRDDTALNINMSSERVRKAKRIIEGVQNGLSLGTVLGSDCERLLHDAYKTEGIQLEMDRFILPLRKKYPLNLPLTKANDDQEPTYTTSTINGSLLIKELRAMTQNLAGKDWSKKSIFEAFTANLGAFTSWIETWYGKNEYTALNDSNKRFAKALLLIVQEVYDSYDALMDVMLSESVYQLCNGNTARVEALMRSLQNETALPMPEVTEMQVASARLANRMIIALPTLEVFDQSIKHSPTALADPIMESWMRSVLGKDLTLYQHVTASDMVYALTDWNSIADYLKPFYLDQTIQSPELQALDLSHKLEAFQEEYEGIEFALDNLRDLVTNSHALRGEELMHESPSDVVKDGVDIKELRQRYIDLYALAEDIVCAESGPTAKFGIQSEGAEAIKLLQERMEIAESIFSGKELKDHTVNDYVTAIHKLTVPNLLITMNFSPDADQLPLEELAAQQKAGYFKNLKGNDALEDWMDELARVREPMQQLQQLRMFQQWNSLEAPSLRPMQVPVAQGKPEWLGVEVSNESKVHNASVYMVMQPENFDASQFTANGKLRGIVVDFWTEKIPYREQTAALSFGFDQPDAEPPQAILFATPIFSSPKKRWSELQLRRCLSSAMYLVKDRVVEPDHLRADQWTSGIFPLVKEPINK